MTKTLWALLAGFAITVGLFIAHQEPFAYGALAVTFVIGLFGVRQRQAEDRKDNADLSGMYTRLQKDIEDTTLLVLRKLSTCADESYVRAAIQHLMEAGRHLGSNPDWRNTRRIIGVGDIKRWYDEGFASVAAAKKMVDDYCKDHPHAGGLGDVSR